jgi:hypothetical protein
MVCGYVTTVLRDIPELFKLSVVEAVALNLVINGYRCLRSEIACCGHGHE